MKFSEMTYTRPDPAASKQRLSALTAELKAAKSYEEARKVFLSQQELMSHISTAATLASIRHSIDTRDKFYDGEENSGTTSIPSLRNTIRRGRQRCSKVPSARTLRRNTAI